MLLATDNNLTVDCKLAKVNKEEVGTPHIN